MYRCLDIWEKAGKIVKKKKQAGFRESVGYQKDGRLALFVSYKQK